MRIGGRNGCWSQSKCIAISPFSVAVGLIMAYVGAKDTTAYQIKNSLHLTKFSDEEIYETVGNLVRSLKVILKIIGSKISYIY